MIERIPIYYVNDECAYITLPFNRCITVFSDEVYEKGILFHYDFSDDSQNINKYLTEITNYSFPYNDIPMYKGLFGRRYINGLFEYNKHYICISDGFIRDRYLVKDNDEALMLNRNLSIPMGMLGKILTRDSIKEILNSYKTMILFDKYGRRYFYDGSEFKDIDKFIAAGGGVFIFEDEYKGLSVKIIGIKTDIGYDSFFYKEYDLSLNDYNKEEFKCFSSKIRDVRKICVHSIVNPNIDRRIIEKNKKLVKNLVNDERK